MQAGLSHATLTPSQYEPIDSEVLGEGPSGVVCRGVDTKNGRDVAIKKVLGDDNDAAWRSATFSASVNYRGLVQVYDIEKTHRWIVLELMAGSLQQHTNKAPLSPDKAETVVSDALEALAYLHDRAFAHGAIRPSNLMFDNQKRVSLSDSRGYSSVDEWVVPAEDEIYVAPEVIQPTFGQAGPSSDLYCLGLSVLHALLGKDFSSNVRGGRLPFSTNRDDWRSWHVAMNNTFEPVSVLVPELSSNVASLMDRLLQKQASERPASASEALVFLRDQSTTPTHLPKSKIDEPWLNKLGRRSEKSPLDATIGPGASVGLSRRQEQTVDLESLIRFARELAQAPVARWFSLAAAVLCVMAVILWPSKGPIRQNVQVSWNQGATMRYRRHDDEWSLSATHDFSEKLALIRGETYYFETEFGGEIQDHPPVEIEENTTSIDLLVTNFLERTTETKHRDYKITITPRTVNLITANGRSILGEFDLDSRNQLVGSHRVHPDADANWPVTKIVVGAPGYYQKRITLSDHALDGTVKLDKIRKLIIRVSEPDAEVWVNDETADRINANMFKFVVEDQKSVVIQAVKNGFEHDAETIDLGELTEDEKWPHEEQLKLSKVEMPELPTFTLFGVPAGGRIKIDGAPATYKQVSSDQGPKIDIVEGTHDVEVSAPGYRTWRRQLVLRNQGSYTVLMQSALISSDNSPAYVAPKVVLTRVGLSDRAHLGSRKSRNAFAWARFGSCLRAV